MPFQFAVAQPYMSENFLASLTALGLTTNLKLVLDAGDALSATGSSATKWLDRSGGGYDFFRGVDGSAAADDPTFNGAVGGRTSGEYWAAASSTRYFNYDSANETWMTAIHKDSAVFSWAFWYYISTIGTIGNRICGTIGGTDTPVGFGLRAAAGTGKPTLVVGNGATNALTKAATPAVNTAAWNFIAGSLDEAAGTLIMATNGTVETFTSQTYSSPSAAAAAQTMNICASGNANGSSTVVDPGDRISAAAMWQGTALSAANFTSLYAATRGKFGV